MSTEVEISFNLNHPLLNNGLPTKPEVIKSLKKIGAKKVGTYLFQVMKFIPPNGSKDNTLRIRNEGRFVTLTYKHKDSKTKYKEEYEVIIDNFGVGIKLLQALRAKESYFNEKIREIWNYKNTEIVFDDIPGLPTIIEIECKSNSSIQVCEKAVYSVANKLGIHKKSNEDTKRSNEMYQEFYGFELKDESLPYAQAKSILGKKCKKNKSELIKIINHQLKIYKKLVQK
jgi:predicted adenylyl cyclase CyaB